MTQMIELVDEGIKKVITTILHMPNEVEEIMNILRTDTEDIKKTQVSLLKIKITVSRIKYTEDGIKSRLDQAEE